LNKYKGVSAAIFSRIRSVIRYLSWADPFYKWKLSRGSCPACDATLFISLKPSDFLTRCLSCKANVVNLSLIPVIKKHFGGLKNTAHAYELSTYGATLGYLKNNFGQVTVSEYMSGEVNGALINGVLNEDILNLTFAENTFDLITSNSVLEHVPDDIKGVQECLRTLKPGGALIFSVPLYDTPLTIRMAVITPTGIDFLSEPEYHDSRLSGPKSALTFWRHSYHDICNRVRAAGFNRVELVDVIITPSQGLPTKVVYAIKDWPST
jgi:SAM-dependent methyltransferase